MLVRIKIFVVMFVSMLFSANIQAQYITSHLQEIRGTGNIPFVFSNYKQITNGISLGSQANPYTILKISYADTATAETNPSLGWQISIKALNNFDAAFGTPNPAESVNLSDITIYVGIGDGLTVNSWRALGITPNINEQVIFNGNQKFVRDTTIFIYYECKQLIGKQPNEYNTLFDFNLSPTY